MTALVLVALAIEASLPEAQAAFEDGDPARVVRELRDTPDSPLVHSMRAYALRDLGDCRQALKETRAYLAQVRDHVPGNREAHEGMLELDRACAGELSREVEKLEAEKKERLDKREAEARELAREARASLQTRFEALQRAQARQAETNRGLQLERLVVERRQELERGAAPFESRTLPDPIDQTPFAAATRFDGAFDYRAAIARLDATTKSLESLRTRQPFDDSSDEGARLFAARELRQALEHQHVTVRRERAERAAAFDRNTQRRQLAQAEASKQEKRTEQHTRALEAWREEADSADERRQTGAWALGAGAALGVGSLVSFLLADSAIEQVRRGSLATAALVQPALDRAQALRITSLGGLVAGGALALGGVIGMLATQQPEPPTTFGLVPVPGGLSATLSGVW